MHKKIFNYYINYIIIMKFCKECDSMLYPYEENSKLFEICKNCGDYVCKRKTCAEIFPHKENENFTICKTCADKIGDKLKISINHDELRLLKEKISIKLQNKMRAIEKSEE